MSYRTHEKTLLVRPEHLNHAGTLFGGYMMMWADELAFTAASLTFPEADLVTRLFERFDFTSPVQNGDIIKIVAQVEEVGNSSCKVAVWAYNARLGEGGGFAEIFRTHVIMVHVIDGKKAPIPRDNG